MRPGSDRLGDHGKRDEHSVAATARVLEPGVTDQARDGERMPTCMWAFGLNHTQHAADGTPTIEPAFPDVGAMVQHIHERGLRA